MKNMFLTLVCVTILTVGNLLAGIGDTLLSFGTKGPDTYSDGTTVLDGECYALVWSKDAAFGGFNSDGSLIRSTDKAVVFAPVAQDGRCPTTLFQINEEKAKEYSDGYYAVYLLDTRISKNGNIVTAGVGNDGNPSFINGYSPVIGAVKATASGFLSIKQSLVTTKSSATRSDATAQTSGAATVCTSLCTEIPEDLDQPKITAIKVVGDMVHLTVENLSGYVGVKDGATVAVEGSENPPVEADGEAQPITIVMPLKSGSEFFKAYRK